MKPPKNIKIKSPIPHEFVLDLLASLSPYTKPMFGCRSVYIPKFPEEDIIALILRDKNDYTIDNGVWIATTLEHHKSLKKELPSMRSITLFGSGPTGWQILPQSSKNFEEEVTHACELILKNDPRIGKVPKKKKAKKIK